MKNIHRSLIIASFIALFAFTFISSETGFVIFVVAAFSFPWGIPGFIAITAGVLTHGGTMLPHIIGVIWIFISIVININLLFKLLGVKDGKKVSFADSFWGMWLIYITSKIIGNNAYNNLIEDRLSKKSATLKLPIKNYHVYTNENTGYWVPVDFVDTIESLKAGNGLFLPPHNFDIVADETNNSLYIVMFLGTNPPNFKKWRHIST